MFVAMRVGVSVRLAAGMMTLYCPSVMHAGHRPRGRNPVEKQAENEKNLE